MRRRDLLHHVVAALGATAAYLLLSAVDAEADEPGDVRGCMVQYLSGSGKFRFEPFLKVADKASASQDGEPEIWGFRPWNLEPPDENGITHPINILAELFVPYDGKAHNVRAGSTQRRIRCPDGLW